MTAYKCNDCKHEFDEPRHIHEKEYADYGIGGRWITTFEGDVCPHCESQDFETNYNEEEA